MSDEAKDLIFKFCTHEETRLGKNDTGEIKAHKFFETIDFDSDLRKKKALYVPQIKDQTDTSNFEPIPSHLLVNRNPNAQAAASGETHGDFKNNTKNPSTQTKADKSQILYEFTFRRFFDEAYPDQFYAHNNGDENPAGKHMNNNNINLNGIFRNTNTNGDKNGLSSSQNEKPDEKMVTSDQDKNNIDADPEIYV